MPVFDDSEEAAYLAAYSNIKLPKIHVLRDYQTPYMKRGNAGIDLRVDRDLKLFADSKEVVHFGITSVLPLGMCALVLARSGLGTGKLLQWDYIVRLSNNIGLIDPSYTGEWKGVIENAGEGIISFSKGDRIAQAIFLPFHLPTNLDFEEESERGAKGFGDSGL